MLTKNYLLDHQLLKDRGYVFRFLYNPLPLPSSICSSFSVCSMRSLHKCWLVAGDISMPGFTWLHFVRSNCGIQTGVGWVRGRQKSRGKQWKKMVLKAFANLQLPGLLKPFSNFAVFDIFAIFPCLCCCSSIRDKKSLKPCSVLE